MRRTGIIVLLALVVCIAWAEDVKSPRQAMIYSLVLPGGGQYYNGQYIKSGVVIGAQIYLGGSAFYHHTKRKDHFDKAMASEGALRTYHLNKRRDYADKLRNDFWWMGIVSFLSIADAMVDAHLSNYEAQRRRVYLKFEDQTIIGEIRF